MWTCFRIRLLKWMFTAFFRAINHFHFQTPSFLIWSQMTRRLCGGKWCLDSHIFMQQFKSVSSMGLWGGTYLINLVTPTWKSVLGSSNLSSLNFQTAFLSRWVIMTPCITWYKLLLSKNNLAKKYFFWYEYFFSIFRLYFIFLSLPRTLHAPSVQYLHSHSSPWKANVFQDCLKL